MRDEPTTIVSARISQTLLLEIHQEIRETGKKLNEFITEAIEEKLLSDNSDFLKAEINKRGRELDVLKKRLETISEKKKNINHIPSQEISFLIETKRIIERDPTFLSGRIRLYKNRFAKHYRMSEQEFLTLLDNAEVQRECEKIKK